ncbi:MAG TPA: hypothetical protein PKL15_10950 [Saprospiraceae bacterium]|nr:hypothetical protein [Saprospiraceae bacterium]HNL40524.1 hypothetical protein [Saprospiraceae bacterium]HNM25943.1 hypothetical protein [Saprospiraceae bacterium]
MSLTIGFWDGLSAKSRRGGFFPLETDGNRAFNEGLPCDKGVIEMKIFSENEFFAEIKRSFAP